MRKLKLLSLGLFTGLMLLQSVPMHADPPPNWEFWIMNDDGDVYHWNSDTNQYELIRISNEYAGDQMPWPYPMP